MHTNKIMTHAQFIEFCKTKKIIVTTIGSVFVNLYVKGNDLYFPYKNKKEADKIDELKETVKKLKKDSKKIRYQCSKGAKSKCKDYVRCEHAKIHKLDIDVNCGCRSRSSYCPKCKVVKEKKVKFNKPPKDSNYYWDDLLDNTNGILGLKGSK